MFIEFDEDKIIFLFNSTSANADFTSDWQSSKVPFTSMQLHSHHGSNLFSLAFPYLSLRVKERFYLGIL
jgi:hypothetical protein